MSELPLRQQREHVLMKCGHVAQAVTPDGSPVCVICLGAPAATEVDDDLVTLIAGRTARCDCGLTVPSSLDLAFFEYRGRGSQRAREICGQCGYSLVAHVQEQQFSARGSITLHNVVVEGKCSGFVAHGPYEFDLFYCGCRGWD